MAFKYRGILARPRPHDAGPGLLANDVQRAAWLKHFKVQDLNLWQALFEAHGVAFGDESELLRRLAETHVPGFKMRQRPSGPQVSWNERTKAELRIAVDDYVQERKQAGRRTSIAQACGVLANREPWVAKLRKGAKPAEALRGHYNSAAPWMVSIVRKARAWEALSPHEKEALVDLREVSRK